MKIRKKIFTSGNSFVIYLDKTIMEGLDLKEGDIVDISDIYKVKLLPKSKNMEKEIKEEVRK